jgi:23S rRNA pseudouridine2605 synthase
MPRTPNPGRKGQSSNARFRGNKPESSRRSSDDRGGDKPRYGDGERKSFGPKKPVRFGDKRSTREERPDSRGGSPKKFEPKSSYPRKDRFDKEEKPKSFGSKFSKPYPSRKREEGDEKKPFVKRAGFTPDEKRNDKRSFGSSKFSKPYSSRTHEEKNDEKKPFSSREKKDEKPLPRHSKFGKRGEERKSFVQSRQEKQRIQPEYEVKKQNDDDLIRLNRFIANSGVCSRREADNRISMGLVSVNGKTITELGFKVKRTDDVRYEGKRLKAEKPVYILLNKPKGFITTTDDPQERKTVMNLIANACSERVYPVGRLDRNTTGLLLLTNDGDLADKLTHPSYKAKKIYKVELDRPITKADFEKIAGGVHLEEGKAMVDDLAIVSDDNKTVGIELHIGWNRIVRRIFESLQYDVVKLDRVVYAGLDKKDIGRGEWRFLKPSEVSILKGSSLPARR